MDFLNILSLFATFDQGSRYVSTSYSVFYTMSDIKDLIQCLGIIHLVRTQNFLKNQHFLPPDMHTYVT